MQMGKVNVEHRVRSFEILATKSPELAKEYMLLYYSTESNFEPAEKVSRIVLKQMV